MDKPNGCLNLIVGANALATHLTYFRVSPLNASSKSVYLISSSSNESPQSLVFQLVVAAVAVEVGSFSQSLIFLSRPRKQLKQPTKQE
jgi:predicted membrane metal-binding protein